MINDVMLQRLDELIGNFDTPFFNYLLYSYDFTLEECEGIVSGLKDDIMSNRIFSDNIAAALESCFSQRLADLEKQKKTDFLTALISEDSEFFTKYLKRYNLERSEIGLIYEKVKKRIDEENISDFEIKRDLEYYFSNSVRQVSYINDLRNIVGRNYDTLIIESSKRKYPILRDSDIIQIVSGIHSDILDAIEFKNGIKHEFQRQCMIKSENKKAECKKKLQKFVEGSGDSFSKMLEFKRLTKKDGEIIVSQIMDDISEGLIQPDDIDSVFITKRFNDYNERK